MRACPRFACLLAVASSACSVDDAAPVARAAAREPAPEVTAAPSPAEEVAPQPAAPADVAPREAIAADLVVSHEPMVVVAGWRDDQDAAGVPVYAQRNGGWRQITTGEWPAGSASVVREVDAADLDGDGVLEVVALGRTGDGEHTRAALVVYRMRDRDLVVVAEALWAGAGGSVAIGEPVDGRRAVLVLGRSEHVMRKFSLEGDHLVARSTGREQPRRQREQDGIAMSLPGVECSMRVTVHPATGGPSMIGTIQEWNAELARLRR